MTVSNDVILNSKLFHNNERVLLNLFFACKTFNAPLHAIALAGLWPEVGVMPPGRFAGASAPPLQSGPRDIPFVR